MTYDPNLPIRRERITASEFGAMLGLSPHVSAQEAIRRKQSEGHSIPPNDAMEAGKYLEPLLLEMSKAGDGWLPPEYEPKAWPQNKPVTSPGYPWAVATPDCECGPEFWEFKTTSQNIEDLSDCPTWHVQLLMQLMLGGKRTGILHVFHLPREMQAALASQSRLGASLTNAAPLLSDFLRASYRRFPVALSVEMAGALGQVGSEIHRRYILGKEDPATWDPPTEKIQRLLCPQDDGTVKKFTIEQEQDVVDLMAVKQTISSLEEREKALREKVIAALGSASQGVLHDGRKVSFRAVSYKGYVKEVPPRQGRVLRLPSSPKNGD